VLSPGEKCQRMVGNILIAPERRQQEVPGYFIFHCFIDFVQYIYSSALVGVQTCVTCCLPFSAVLPIMIKQLNIYAVEDVQSFSDAELISRVPK